MELDKTPLRAVVAAHAAAAAAPTPEGAQPETKEPVAPVQLTAPFPFLHLHVYAEHLNTDSDDSAG